MTQDILVAFINAAIGRMIEPEIAFCDLNMNMNVAENMVKAVIEVGPIHAKPTRAASLNRIYVARDRPCW